MRRITVLLVTASFAVAACASDSDTDSTTAGTGASESTAAAVTEDTQAAAEPPVEPTVAGNPDKPEVEIPGELPTTLMVTELRAGDGDEAAEGDTVVVHYVGVRSEDGLEFDNSWDRGSTFPVTLGLGQVIPGWEQGLLGVQTGGQYQLDIPADLAYGDTGSGDVIRPGDALSFVIDVMGIVTPSSEADQPDVSVPTSEGATELGIEDLVVGDGAEAEAGDTVYIDLVAYRGDTGEAIDSTWGVGGPFEITLTENGALPGIVQGVEGMKVGGRRQLVIPSADAFGEAGSETPEVPPNTDLILVIDLAAVV